MNRDLALVALLVLAACGGSPAADGGVDASTSDLGPRDLDVHDDRPPDDGTVDAPPPDLGCTTDADGDGHLALACGGDDCNDADAAVHPGATEACNGADDDCNGTIDDAVPAAAWCNDASRALPNATATCRAGICEIDTCSTAYVDCSSTAPGCEMPADDSNCGACGHACLHAGCVDAVCANDYVQIQVAAAVSCARRGGGTIECWGDNSNGQLGIDSTVGSMSTPTAVAGISDAVDMACDLHGYCCAVRASGAISCWGRRSGAHEMAPVDVGAYTDARFVAVLVPGVTTSTVKLWVVHGDAIDELAESASGWTTTTVVPSGATGARALAVARYGSAVVPHPCVLTAGGTVGCPDSSGALVDVVGLADITRVMGSHAYGYALQRDGVLYGWQRDSLTGLPRMVDGRFTFSTISRMSWPSDGDGFEYLVTDAGDVINVNGFPPAATLAPAAEISGTTTSDHLCALLRTGEAVCWGSNTYGQLGDGATTTPDPSVAVTVVGS